MASSMSPILALSISDKIEQYGAYAGFASVLGLAVLSLLYFAQAREVKRLREWAGRSPERAAEQQERVLAEAQRRAQAQPIQQQQPGQPAQAPKPAAVPATPAGQQAQNAPGSPPQPGAPGAPAAAPAPRPAPPAPPPPPPPPAPAPAAGAAAARPAAGATATDQPTTVHPAPGTNG